MLREELNILQRHDNWLTSSSDDDDDGRVDARLFGAEKTSPSAPPPPKPSPSLRLLTVPDVPPHPDVQTYPGPAAEWQI